MISIFKNDYQDQNRICGERFNDLGYFWPLGDTILTVTHKISLLSCVLDFMKMILISFLHRQSTTKVKKDLKATLWIRENTLIIRLIKSVSLNQCIWRFWSFHLRENWCMDFPWQPGLYLHLLGAGPGNCPKFFLSFCLSSIPANPSQNLIIWRNLCRLSHLALVTSVISPTHMSYVFPMVQLIMKLSIFWLYKFYMILMMLALFWRT